MNTRITNRYFSLILFFVFLSSRAVAQLQEEALKPVVATQPTLYDSDDPAIWINPSNAAESLVIGTDKNSEGALYLYNLEGKIIKKSIPLKRPNNVDIAYGLSMNGKKVDIAVCAERETDKLRVFSLPDLTPIDGGGISVFEGEEFRAPMGIALYTRPKDKKIFAIVSRKNGPPRNYLWEYELRANKRGIVKGKLARKFGAYSQRKEIEAVAVDNELGFVYYCDERAGIRKYVADPGLNNDMELAHWGESDFKKDNEGIAIYKTSATTGYILVSNQGANTLLVYPREGSDGNPNTYKLIAEIPLSASACDGLDATNAALGDTFPKGMVATMSSDKTFHFYNWEDIARRIAAAHSK